MVLMSIIPSKCLTLCYEIVLINTQLTKSDFVILTCLLNGWINFGFLFICKKMVSISFPFIFPYSITTWKELMNGCADFLDICLRTFSIKNYLSNKKQKIKIDSFVAMSQTNRSDFILFWEFLYYICNFIDIIASFRELY